MAKCENRAQERSRTTTTKTTAGDGYPSAPLVLTRTKNAGFPTCIRRSFFTLQGGCRQTFKNRRTALFQECRAEERNRSHTGKPHPGLIWPHDADCYTLRPLIALLYFLLSLQLCWTTYFLLGDDVIFSISDRSVVRTGAGVRTFSNFQYLDTAECISRSSHTALKHRNTKGFRFGTYP